MTATHETAADYIDPYGQRVIVLACSFRERTVIANRGLNLTDQFFCECGIRVA